MTLYDVSGKCPHCGALTFLSSMSEAQYANSELTLVSILHTLICRHCGKRFGKHAGQLHREAQE